MRKTLLLAISLIYFAILLTVTGLRIYSGVVEPQVLLRHASRALISLLPFWGIGMALLHHRMVRGWSASRSQKRVILGISFFLASFFLVCSSGKTQMFSPVFCFSMVVKPLESEEIPFEITWMTTGKGDISYAQLRLEGWEWVRDLNVLRLRSPQNLLKWCGVSGERILIVKQGNAKALVRFNWNGLSEEINMPRGEYIYVKKTIRLHSLRNPETVFAWSSFFVFALGILANIWPRKWFD